MIGRPGALNQGRINWSAIEKPDFERVVEALLHRKFDIQGFEAHVLDGRGGDGGIDVGIWDLSRSRYNHIFQLKYFPEGFSSGHIRRRDQIKKSFNTAIEKHGPLPLWTLVTPGNPTETELAFVKGLKGKKRVKISVWGRAQLEDYLASYPDIERAALRNELVDVLRETAQEQAGLVRATDLPERALALYQRADSRSIYWGVDIEVKDGVVTQTLRAKHPLAREHEPISWTIGLAFNEDNEDLRKQTERALAYGARRPLTLPAEVIESFHMEGPEWIRESESEDNLTEVVIQPNETAPQPITLVVLDTRGVVARSAPGTAESISSGAHGHGISASFYSRSLTIDADLPKDPNVGGNFDVGLSLSDIPTTDAYRSAMLFNSLTSGAILELRLRGKTFTKGRLHGHPEQIDPATLLLLEDLYILEQTFGVSYTLPESTSSKERLEIRIARLLAEGRSTWMPPGTVFPVNLNDNLRPELTDLLLEGGAVFAELPSFLFPFQGLTIDLGPAFVYHPHVVAEDGASAAARIRAGSAQNEKVTLVPQGNQGIMVHLLASRTSGSDHLPPTVSWNLPDMPEYSELASGMQDPDERSS
jgi:hypothetical protein